MRHLFAAQRVSDGKWHYVSANKRSGVYPIGHCANDCPGHDTAEEARGHYREYLLDRATYSAGPDEPDTLHRCEVPECKRMTAGYAIVPRRFLHPSLCDQHRNREGLSQILTVGESWVS